jgi:DNA repair exonuclease SbcCD ATPase subunit
MQRQRGSFRDAPVNSDLVNSMAADNVAQMVYYEKELELEREELKRHLAAMEEDHEAHLQDDTTDLEKETALDSKIARQWQDQENRQDDISALLTREYRAYAAEQDAKTKEEDAIYAIPEQLTHVQQDEEARRQIEEDRQFAEALEASLERSPPQSRRHHRKSIRRPTSNPSKVNKGVAFVLAEELVGDYSTPAVDLDLGADRVRYLKYRERKSKEEDAT